MSLVEKVANSFTTIIEMLTDRKLLDSDEIEMLSSFQRNELDKFANKSTSIFNIDVGEKIRIIYYIGKFQKNEFRPFVENTKFELYLVIMAEKLTSGHMKEIARLEKPDNSMQFFDLKEVAFNITKHVLVPRHEVIDDEEKIKEIVEKYNVRSKHHFPIMLKTDPVARYYGINSGSLVKIVRVSPSSGEYTLYRCCV